MNIDEWMNIPCDDDKHSSDDEAVVVDYDYGMETAEFANRNQAFPPNQKCQNKPNTNLQVGSKCNTLAGISNLPKHYFDDIMNVSIWPQKGIDNSPQPPISKQAFNTNKDMENDWLPNLNKFKGNVKIAETRTICYSRNCDSDSVDTAEYIRGARGKGNKSTGKTRNRLIKKYSKVATIQFKKTIEVNRIKRKINSNFPLDESDQSNLEEEVVNKNKTNRNNHHYPHNNSETPPRIYNKMGRNRLKSQTNTVKARLHLNSGSFSDSKQRYRSSCSSDSDPDDRILDNVRKIHKNITQDIIAEPIIEFPPGTDQQVVIYDHNKCATVPLIELSNDSDEDVPSEEDILCMSNSKRLLLNGKCNMEYGNRQAFTLYDRTKTDDYSTDDDLFRPQSYRPKAK